MAIFPMVSDVFATVSFAMRVDAYISMVFNVFATVSFAMCADAHIFNVFVTVCFDIVTVSFDIHPTVRLDTWPAPLSPPHR